jgi:hypothetical protein
MLIMIHLLANIGVIKVIRQTNTLILCVGCKGFRQLRLLDLCGCQISSWYQIFHFSELPMIQELLVDSNPIESILPSNAHTFQSLQRLSLSATK